MPPRRCASTIHCSTTMRGTTASTTPTLRSRSGSLRLKGSSRARLSDGRPVPSVGLVGRRRALGTSAWRPLGGRASGRRGCGAPRAWAGTGEAHLRDGAVILVRGEERNGLEAERPGDQVARKRLQRDVVVAGAGVVVTAGVLDLVLGGGQRLLQLQETLDRP